MLYFGISPKMNRSRIFKSKEFNDPLHWELQLIFPHHKGSEKSCEVPFFKKIFCVWLCWVFGAMQAFAVSRGYSLVMHGLLIVVASLVGGTGSRACRLRQFWHVGSVVVAPRLSSCGPWAQLLCGMWDIPANVSLLAGGFFTTEPPGSPKFIFVE